MRENELCIALIKCITEVLIDHAQNQTEVLKIISVGVQSAINSHEKKGK